MTNLFVYGSLMYDEVWKLIVDGDFEKSKGQISGYRRVVVKDEEYPGLVAGEDIVAGCIWYGVDHNNIRRLDSFEGEYYERIPAQAINEAGDCVEVSVYRFKKHFYGLLENKDWDVNEFEKSGLKKFIDRYVGFDRMK